MLHWKDKSEEPQGTQPKDDKRTQADIAEGNCSKLLLLSKNTFLGNFLVKCTLLYFCTPLWPRFFLTISFFYFQLETFCKEAFGNVSACRHYETQKKEWKKERERRPWRRRYTKVWPGVGSALVTICGVVFWLYNGFWVKSNTKHQMGNCRFKVDTHANTASIGVWWKIRAAPLGRMVDADVALNRAG